MKEDNKYYTPEITEFYVGFEYEIRIGSKWNPAICQGHIPIGNKTLEDLYRVKYLSKEDIEELGWEETMKDQYYLGDYRLDVWHHKNVPYLLIHSPIKTPIFIGCVKNKSVFKQLIKMLEI